MTEALFSLHEVTPTKPANQEPEWLTDLLAHPPRRHPRITQWEHCPRCGLLTLEGDDADMLAFQTRVDPTPVQLDPVAEANGILQARYFYQATPANRPHAYKLHNLITHNQGAGHLYRGSTFTNVLPSHNCTHGYLMEPLLAQTPDPKPVHPDDPPPF